MGPVRIREFSSHAASAIASRRKRPLHLNCHLPPLRLSEVVRCYSTKFDDSSELSWPQEEDTSVSEPSASTSVPPAQSAAAYLLAQAELEELEEVVQKVPKVVEMALQEPAWDGDEPQARAIRRILADQYKPLRVKGYKKKIPEPASLPSILFHNTRAALPPADSSATPKNPWDFTFKAPDTHQPLVRSGVKLPPVRGPTGKSIPRSQRVASAYERSLDYGAGFGGGGKVLVPTEDDDGHSQQNARVPMGDMRAWNGFVEDKIEEARRKGLFKNVKGRGKPMKRDEAESNPFIKREEFLINRIVQSQGAAPPWVEAQGELEQAVSVFRSELRQSWSRRAIRMQSLGGVSRTSIMEVLEGWRDKEWEQRERAFHEASVKSMNSLIRRYNTLAPYSVRKTPLSLNHELSNCFRDSAKYIEKELLKRMAGENSSPLKVRTKGDKEIVGEVADEEIPAVKESMWRGFRRLVRELVGNQEPGKSDVERTVSGVRN